ncbi:MAG: EthD domain-containing protein [Gemmatimonadaceae bacterium]
MVKLIYCFRRRRGMSDAEFDAYWAGVHGPIAARIPGLRRLVQSRALRIPGDVRPPDFDGVAELWFDDPASLLRARASEAWRLSGLDEANFLDPSSAAYLVSEERVILDRGAVGASPTPTPAAPRPTA